MSASSSPTSSLSVNVLTDMGFSEQQARQALHLASDNVVKAIEWLFAQEEGEKNNSMHQTHTHSSPPSSSTASVALPSRHSPRTPVSVTTPGPHLYHPPPLSPSPSKQYSGVVCDVVSDRGFGYIRVHNRAQRLFYHQSEVLGGQLLSEGDEVQFQIGMNPKKELPQAEQIRAVKLHNPATKGQQWRRDPSRAAALTATAAANTSHARISELPQYGFVTALKGNKAYISPSSSSHILAARNSVQEKLLTSLLPAELVPLVSIGSLVSFHSATDSSGAAEGVHLVKRWKELTESQYHASTNKASSLDSYFLHNQQLAADETRHIEFKSLLHNRDLEHRIAQIVNKYSNAFLNSEGGWLYVGVDDSAVVNGIAVDQHQRDLITRQVDSVMHSQRPAVDTRQYEMRFMPVYDVIPKPSIYVLVPLPDVYVLVLHVLPPPASSSPLYWTSGDYDDNRQSHAWLRRDGSVRDMPPAMIAERTKQSTQQNLQEMKQQLMADLLNTLKQEQQQPITASSPSSASSSSPSALAQRSHFAVLTRSLVDQFEAMGVDRSNVLTVLYDMQQEGKINMANTTKQDVIIAEIWDRIHKLQQQQQQQPTETGMEREDKKEKEEAAPSSFSALSSSLYPVVLPESPRPPVSIRSGRFAAPVTIDDDENMNDAALPCEFCSRLFPSHALEEHQRQCRSESTAILHTSDSVDKPHG